MLTEITLSINNTDPEAVGVGEAVSAVGYRCLRTVASRLIKRLRCLFY